jgi:hypothetical protein
MNGPCDDNVAHRKKKGKTGMSKSVAIVSGSRSGIGKAQSVLPTSYRLSCRSARYGSAERARVIG